MKSPKITPQVIESHLNSKDFVAAKECVEKLLANKKGIEQLYNSKLMKKSLFWNIDFSNLNIQDSALKKIFFILWKHEKEFKEEYQIALEKLSKEELLYTFALHVERENALMKYKAKWQEKHSYDSTEKAEMFRQNKTMSTIHEPIQFIVDRFFDKLPSNIARKANNAILEKIPLIFLCIANIKFITQMLEFYASPYWEYVEESSNVFCLLPKAGEEKKAIELLHHNFAPQKNRCQYNFCSKKFGENALALIEKNKNENVKRNIPALERFDDNLSEKDKLDIMMPISINIEAHHSEVMEWSLFTLGGIDFNCHRFLKMKDSTSIDITELFNITSFLRVLSVHAINNIDDNFSKAVDKHDLSFRFSGEQENYFHKELRALNKSAKNLSATEIAEIKKRTIEIENTPMFKKYQEFIISNAFKDISNTLMSYDYNELVNLVNSGTGIEKASIKKIIDVFIFKVGDKILDKPFFLIDNQLFWIPNTVAYNSFQDSLYEIIILDELCDLHQYQTFFFEKTLGSLLKDKGYKTIHSHTIYDANKNPVSDFDTLAYKDGILFHFEIKLSSKRRETYFDKKKWYQNQFLKAANTQIPIQRNYIVNNIAEIETLLNLG